MSEANTVTGEMVVVTERIHFSSAGSCDVTNITAEIRRLAKEVNLKAGIVTVFAPGATASITTLEWEPGVIQDFQRLFDQIVPVDQHYQHNDNLGDGNGHSHVRAGLLGPSLVVPIEDGVPLLGRWQEISFVCLDAVPRERTAIVQFMGVK